MILLLIYQSIFITKLIFLFCINPKNFTSELEKWTNLNKDNNDLNLLSFLSSENSKNLKIKIIKLKDNSGMLTKGINSRSELEALSKKKN